MDGWTWDAVFDWIATPRRELELPMADFEPADDAAEDVSDDD